MKSHVQTRVVVDALQAIDRELQTRGARLAPSAERASLEQLFSRNRHPEILQGWAFEMDDFDKAVSAVAAISPMLARQLTPALPGAFAIVGRCAIDLRFDTVSNGAKSVAIHLDGGRRLLGAYVKCVDTDLYQNGVIGVPAVTGARVYFYRPNAPLEQPAAALAQRLFREMTTAERAPTALCFPRAETHTIVEYPWVCGLKSECNSWRVAQFLSIGEALVDKYGFFAKETTVTVAEFFCDMGGTRKVVIDGPFLVFAADESGIVAAAWFSWDSFSTVPPGTHLPDADDSEPALPDIDELFED